MLVDFGGRVLERRRLEREFPTPDEAVAFVTESVRGLRRLGGGDDHPGSPDCAWRCLNLGSWQRELDVPPATYRSWNEFDVDPATHCCDRARRVLRE